MLWGSSVPWVSALCALTALTWGSWPLAAILLLPWLLLRLLRPPLRVPEGFQVIVVGAGPAGIAMGKRLNDLGIRFTILEKECMLGGTWYRNTYPGCQCDIFAHLYSFSFFLNSNWSRAYPGQKELLAYLQTVASKFGVLPHIRFNTVVVKNTWDAKTNMWTVETMSGEKFTGNVVVSAVGLLHQLRYPNFPGIKEFEGEAFHTNTWQEGFSAKGMRVAVIGTGASAVQVVPSLVDQEPASLTVFQRSPVWALPRGDYAYPEWAKIMFAVVPLAKRLYRWYLFWDYDQALNFTFTKSQKATELNAAMREVMKAQVNDSELAARLTPDYDMGCKRPTTTDTYLPAFNKEFVHLNTTNIDCITKKGIKTVDGIEHKLDAIVYATGFDLIKSANAFEQQGVQGSLADDYGSAPAAYLGITHHNHPNFFVLFGPGTINSSVFYMIECQVEYTIDGITKMLKSGAKSMVVKTEVFKNYQEFIRNNNKTSTFAQTNCTSYYRDSAGHNWVVWTWLMRHYWWYTKSFLAEEYNATF